MHDRSRSPLVRTVGCLVGGVIFVLPIAGVVVGALGLMSWTHSVEGVARDLGLSQGPPYGYDGWYVGQYEGRRVALAAIYRGGGPAVIRQRHEPFLQVAVCAPDVALAEPVVWKDGAFRGGRLPLALASNAQRFARQQGDLEIWPAADPWPCPTGAVLLHAWPGGVPDVEDVRVRWTALGAILSDQ